MSSVFHHPSNAQEFQAFGAQRLRPGDLVMIVGARNSRYLGQFGAIIDRTENMLRGDESAWERRQILSRDWAVMMREGPNVHALKDKLIVTDVLAFPERCLMRVGDPQTGVEVSAIEEATE